MNPSFPKPQRLEYINSRRLPPPPADSSLALRIGPTVPQTVAHHHRSLRSNLFCSIGDGACFSLMVGLGETYISAFVLKMQGGEIASGLVTAVPLLVGAMLQLTTPWAVKRCGSHKRWVMFCVVGQCLCLGILPLLARVGPSAVYAVFLLAMGYWACGLSAGPAWNTWIEGVVPRRVRTRFFAARVRVSQACILIGFIVGGFALQYGKLYLDDLTVFAILFSVATVFRILSGVFLALQSEPRHVVQERHVSVAQIFSTKRSPATARLLSYLFSVQAAAFIAGPYFTPYMFDQLHFSYSDYAILIGTSFLAKVVTLKGWGKLAHRAGAMQLLWIGGVSIIPMSVAWLVSSNFLYLCGVQIFAGVTWAAYELAFFLLFFEAIPREERTSVLTIYNFGYAAAQVLGALIGAVILHYFEKTAQAYLILFAVSSVARAGTLFLLARIPPVRMPRDIGEPAIRTMSMSASDEGSFDQPILPSLPDEPERAPASQRP